MPFANTLQESSQSEQILCYIEDVCPSNISMCGGLIDTSLLYWWFNWTPIKLENNPTLYFFSHVDIKFISHVNETNQFQ